MKALVAIATFACVILSTGASHICGYGAGCANSTCYCPRDRPYGDPEFNCYNPHDWYRCSVKYDPTLHMYSGQHVALNLISSVTLSIARTPIYGSRSYGSCQMEVYAFPTRYHGKFYIFGVQIVLYVRRKVVANVRVYSKVTRDSRGHMVYNWYIYVVKHYRGPYSYFQSLSNYGRRGCTFEPVRGYKISYNVCTKSNFLIVDVASCGQQVGLRPYNPYRRNIPGVFIKVKKTSRTYFLGLPRALCHKPHDPKIIDYYQHYYKLKNHRDVLTYFSLRQRCPSDYYGSPSRLQEFRSIVWKCKKQNFVVFVRYAEVLFRNSALIQYLGEYKLKALIDLIIKILKAYCYHPKDCRAQCLGARYIVKTYCYRTPYYQKLWNLVEHVCYGLYSGHH